MSSNPERADVSNVRVRQFPPNVPLGGKSSFPFGLLPPLDDSATPPVEVNLMTLPANLVGLH
jgi:hypothetical protein